MRAAALALAALAFAGCTKHQQDAVIAEKIYIPARDSSEAGEGIRLEDPQWLVRIQMTDGRRASSALDESEWKAYAVGDRVRADYRKGKYTGAIWYVEIRRR